MAKPLTPRSPKDMVEDLRQKKAEWDKRNIKTSGGGLHEMGKGSVRAAIASERYLSDSEVKLHNMHMHDQVFITNNDEHVEKIAMKQ